jgi:hypothetical protein
VIRVERAWWPGLAALGVGNLVPLLGVLALEWDLGVVLLLYWAESAVILLFSLVKVAIVSGKASFFLVPFFIVHAGGFMLVHLLFLFGLFVDRPEAGWSSLARDVVIGAGALFLSHLVSFVANIVRRGERPTDAGAVMTGFYSRIVVMQVTIIFGAMLLFALGSPVWALALLVVVKTGVDALAHLRERAKTEPTLETPPTDPQP